MFLGYKNCRFLHLLKVIVIFKTNTSEIHAILQRCLVEEKIILINCSICLLMQLYYTFQDTFSKGSFL